MKMNTPESNLEFYKFYSRHLYHRCLDLFCSFRPQFTTFLNPLLNMRLSYIRRCHTLEIVIHSDTLLLTYRIHNELRDTQDHKNIGTSSPHGCTFLGSNMGCSHIHRRHSRSAPPPNQGCTNTHNNHQLLRCWKHPSKYPRFYTKVRMGRMQ